MPSKWFSVSEMLATSTGLDNTPPTESPLWSNIDQTMQRLDDVREVLGKPVRITSGYRSAAVNKAIGGEATSAHCLGHAADFVCANQDPADLCRQVIEAGIQFDQLIAEYRGSRWVHISFAPKMRGEVLTYRNGKYTPGL